ncbi:triose-phosphate isomerase [Parvularcula marina]|uniref:triose-phosphate isomerase n=1 Tax=Parvularcula marina TaxID=2292771 RepID=UPI0035122736
MKRLIAGNWKMHGLKAAMGEIEALSGKLTPADLEKSDVLICPPATLLMGLAERAHNGVALGGQNCHQEEMGAFTGDISAEMLAEAGASYCIVGHSERRAKHGEHDALVRQKADACHRAGITPIICVGESFTDRAQGKAVKVVTSQLWASLPEDHSQVVVAYEPVWAVGSGAIPTLDDIGEVHAALREVAGQNARILYGGSVKPSNAAQILSVPNVHGVLVGGASLKAEEFYGIISA